MPYDQVYMNKGVSGQKHGRHVVSWAAFVCGSYAAKTKIIAKI